MKSIKATGKIAKGLAYMANRAGDVASRAFRFGKYVDGGTVYTHSEPGDWKKGKEMIKEGIKEY